MAYQDQIVGGASAGPVRNRLTHIDSLRGLALFGVILMNVGSMVMMFNARAVFAEASAADMAAAAIDLVLVAGKARSCFAFLFGAGFAVLLMRAEARGDGFRAFYVRRLIVLLGFGAVNQIFLFWGDILVTYALLGFVLLLFAGARETVLLRLGLALVIAPPLLHGLAEALLGLPLPNLIETPRGEAAARGLAAFTSPSYADAVAENVRLGTTRHATSTAHMIDYDLGVLGLFLLGAWSVRTGILLDPLAHRARLRRIVAWCLPVGLTLGVINALPFLGISAAGLARAGISAAFVGVPILAFAYLAGLALLFARGAGPVQALLAPAGRMSLTNYLASGAIGGWFFYGYGLGRINAVGLMDITLLAIALFLGLALSSRWWLARYAHGPAEWLWRRLAYGPLRRDPRPSLARDSR